MKPRLSRMLLLVGFLSVIAPRVTGAQMYEVVDFGALDEGKAFVVRGLNSAEEIVGGAPTIGGGHRAFKLSRTGVLPAIDDFDWSTSLGINELGAIVGSANGATALRAFLRKPNGEIVTLGTLPGDIGSEAFGINRHNEAAGYSSGPAGIQAVFWAADGEIQGLGTLPGSVSSRAFAINDRGDVVGTSTSALGLRAVLWTKTGGMQDLNFSIPAGAGFVLATAVAINAQGAIVALGHVDAGHGHGHGNHDVPTRVILLVPRS